MPLPLTGSPVLTAGQFRSDLIEFTDKSKYPDASINYWLIVATLLLNPQRWGRMLQLGLELYVAHNIVLEAQSTSTAIAGGWPGLNKGVISNQQAGAVTVTFDTAPTVEPDAGHWNLTVYGTRFIRLARMAGAGPLYIGPGGDCNGGAFNGPAWGGPLTKPGWFSS